MAQNVYNKKHNGLNLPDALFKYEVVTTFTNSEDPEDPPTTNTEQVRKLNCTIDSVEEPINTLMEGIKENLGGQVEKWSEKNQRNCIFNIKREISSLPIYFIVQNLRFTWKQIQQGTQTTGAKAKILRNVIFPKVLDVEPFLTNELKGIIQPARKMVKQSLEGRNLRDTEKFDEWKKSQLENETEVALWKKFKVI